MTCDCIFLNYILLRQDRNQNFDLPGIFVLYNDLGVKTEAEAGFLVFRDLGAAGEKIKM